MKEYRELTKVEKGLLGLEPDFDITMEDILNLGKALLVVAGADGKVPEIEMLAFWKFMHSYADIPDFVRQELKDFDFINTELDEVFPKNQKDKSPYPYVTAKRLTLGAITISMADGQYHQKERAAAIDLGAQLGIDWEVVLKIEAIAEQISASYKMGALFLNFV